METENQLVITRGQEEGMGEILNGYGVFKVRGGHEKI